MRQNIQIRPPDTLQRAVMTEVRQFFDTRTAHRPSEHMFEALADIPKTVSDIITGSAKKAYHVCQLDTGVGKSITLAKTIKTLRAPGMSGSAGQVGTVICVGRYTQIKTMAEDMQLQPSEFAVLVSSAAPAEIQQMGMGVDRINEAPILLTTHSMVQSRLSKAGHTWVPSGASEGYTDLRFCASRVTLATA